MNTLAAGVGQNWNGKEYKVGGNESWERCALRNHSARIRAGGRGLISISILPSPGPVHPTPQLCLPKWKQEPVSSDLP